jgi:hypothetical protein
VVVEIEEDFVRSPVCSVSFGYSVWECAVAALG